MSRTWAPRDTNPRGRVLPSSVPSVKRVRRFEAIERRLWKALYCLGYGVVLFWMLNGFSL